MGLGKVNRGFLQAGFEAFLDGLGDRNTGLLKDEA
jgi:hypothetical protein